MDLAQVTHRNVLLQRHRCGVCAEATTAVQILREEPCAFCGHPLKWSRSDDAASLSEKLHATWNGRRWVVVGAVLVLSVLGGQIPMLQSLLMVATLIFLHVWLIRRPLKWFPPGRRLCAALNVKILLVVISMFILFVNVLIWPFACANGIVLAGLGVLGVLLHVQGAFFILERRLRWEVEGRPFGIHDWLVPVFLLGMLLLVTVTGTLSMYLAWEWMMGMTVPWTEMDVREFLFG